MKKTKFATEIIGEISINQLSFVLALLFVIGCFVGVWFHSGMDETTTIKYIPVPSGCNCSCEKVNCDISICKEYIENYNEIKRAIYPVMP